MTDNFIIYKNFIRFCGILPESNKDETLDRYYVIELIRRGKDNPDMSAANYHFKNYYIYSIHDLDKYEKEIKDICTLLKLRAYGSVNYKVMSQVALDTLAECARRIANHDSRKFYNIFESCSGKFTDKGNNLWIVDIDDNPDAITLGRLITYINSMKSGYNNNVLFKIPTKSGMHLITHPFNLQQFNSEWDLPLTLPDVKKNHITLLYENL